MEAICEVSANALKHNYEFLRSRVRPAAVIPVVKANAYGHGAVKTVDILQEDFSIPLFAVATLEEAQELETARPGIPVLIFSRIFPHELKELPENAFVTVGSMEDVHALATGTDRSLNVHLNVNTGMNRLGLRGDEALKLVQNPPKHFKVKGAYSHFSSSDARDLSVFDRQQAEFAELSRELDRLGFDGLLHCANSAAGLMGERVAYQAIRQGISLYGFDPREDPVDQANLKPVMAVKAPLIRIDEIPAGTPVSYSERWTSTVPTRIGTLRIGYADGYRRSLTNRGRVILEERVFPVVGTVTMDHIMIDLGETDVQTGTYFTIMGGEHPANSMMTLARELETITYELTCGVSPRVRRVYL